MALLGLIGQLADCLTHELTQSLCVDHIRPAYVTFTTLHFTTLNLCFLDEFRPICCSHILKICFWKANTLPWVAHSCLGRSSHTRMSWLMPHHSNRSCLCWSGMNSWPSQPSLLAICGMAAADILCGSKTGRKPCCLASCLLEKKSWLYTVVQLWVLLIYSSSLVCYRCSINDGNVLKSWWLHESPYCLLSVSPGKQP